MAATVVTLNGIEFVMAVGSDLYESASVANRFVVGKSPEMIAALKKHLAGKPVRNIVDLGIYKGGSCALYNELFTPKKLVAIDYQRDEVEPLRAYIEARGAAERIKPCYGVDQSDLGALARIYEDEFGWELLDLVVDDASHLYEQTRASFNFLFPRVRPGGVYVIEDWAWSHWPGAEWQDPSGFFAGKAPLSILVFEIAMTCASMEEGAVRSLHVTGNCVYIERGHGALDDSFDIGRSYLCQGKAWGPQGDSFVAPKREPVEARTRTGIPGLGAARALTGLWWNPDEGGWGLYVSQRGDICFAVWCAFDDAGNPRWYVAPRCTLPSASPKGPCTGSLYEARGPAGTIETGSMVLDFADADCGSMSVTVAGRTRAVPIVRQVFADGAMPPAVDYTDLWWNPDEPGWGVAITHRFNVLVAVLCVCDAAGDPVWYVAPSCNLAPSRNGGGGTLYAMTGPPFGPGFDATKVQSSDVGDFSVRFSGPDNGTLSCRIGDVELTKAITRQLF